MYGSMGVLVQVVVAQLLWSGWALGSELTFELPDNAKHNEFSTFTHKTVYFDFQVGEDPPLFPNENRVTALTQMESACVSIHEALKSVIDYQTHFRLREAQGRSRAEDLNTRVAFWSIGEAFILLVVSISQVVLLRSFFSDRKTTTTRVGS
ncbi:hypothetical protein CRUP_001711 [Coryphaenoides rupestris]|nr:hypothetical protein CRUP_001711 [Coryphaenoides rupestris]